MVASIEMLAFVLALGPAGAAFVFTRLGFDEACDGFGVSETVLTQSEATRTTHLAPFLDVWGIIRVVAIDLGPGIYSLVIGHVFVVAI